MGILDSIIIQTRKPTGFLGYLMAKGMNQAHKKFRDWALSHIEIRDDSAILDIGCGGGGTINKLAKIAPEGKIYGLDYSTESVKASIKKNKKLIQQGRIEITNGNVSSLPYTDNFFDIITAVETHIFWPDLESDMQEVLRVLKPQGIFLVVTTIYKNDKYDKRNKKLVKILNLNYLSLNELEKLFNKAGYKDINVIENYDKGWICGYAKK